MTPFTKATVRFIGSLALASGVLLLLGAVLIAMLFPSLILEAL